jgi:hypothetical protein
MDDAPEPEIPEVPEAPAAPHRRRHSNVWKNTPQGVKISVALCLLFLFLFLLINRNRTPAESEIQVKPKVSAGEAFDKVVSNMPKQIDLVLTKSALNPATSRIEGIVTNTSERRYSNVEIVFFVSLSDLVQGTTTVVRVPNLDPHGNARFATDQVDRNIKEWAVQSIGGTPR